VFVVTIVFGLALIAVGVVGFVATGSEHYTALIPAVPGLLLVVLGSLAARPALRKHAMHGAAMVGLLGFLGTVMGVPKAITLATGGTVERPAAAVSQTVTAALCLVFVGLCVNSFVQARRRRRASEASG
jgi:hypothetical protein